MSLERTNLATRKGLETVALPVPPLLLVQILELFDPLEAG